VLGSVRFDRPKFNLRCLTCACFCSVSRSLSFFRFLGIALCILSFLPVRTAVCSKGHNQHPLTERMEDNSGFNQAIARRILAEENRDDPCPAPDRRNARG
jgi:hypothetical protein